MITLGYVLGSCIMIFLLEGAIKIDEFDVPMSITSLYDSKTIVRHVLDMFSLCPLL